MLKTIAISALLTTAAYAQAPPTVSTPLPINAPPPLHASGDELMKYKADMVENTKHTRAAMCVEKIKSAGLTPTPENIEAECKTLLRQRSHP